jgi:hypothetical protein
MKHTAQKPSPKQQEHHCCKGIERNETHDAFLSGRGLRNSKMNEPSNREKGPAMVGSSSEANRSGFEVFAEAIESKGSSGC